MSKGNPFLGMMRGKVGDVVFYRLDGEQVTRARNRHPRNPNSVRQQVQRAVMANIQQLYSSGQAIFNHAFQGYRPGMENQRRFTHLNAGILRSLVVTELNASTAAAVCKGRVGAKSLNVPSPFDGLMISQGTYDQTAFSFSNGAFKLPDASEGETVAQYAARVGLIPDDLYTFVGYGVGFDDVVANLNVEEESASGNFDRLYNCRFEYVQFKVKSGILADTTVMTAATLITALFEDYQHSGEPFADSFNYNGAINVQDILTYADGGCIGCIRSREFEDLRSNSYLRKSLGNWGFASAYLLDVWDSATTLEGTTLVLEGANFRHAGGSALPTLPTDSGYYYVAGTFGSSVMEEINNPVVFLERDGDTASIDLSCLYDSYNDIYSPWVYNGGEVESSGIDLSESDADTLATEVSTHLEGKYVDGVNWSTSSLQQDSSVSGVVGAI